MVPLTRRGACSWTGVTSFGRAARPPLAWLSAGARRRPPARPRRRAVTLVPVDVSWDRVIRTTTGLRPHREAGFVLRADRLDEKTVIHNYGHGGAGMSLSWGTAHLAADLAVEHVDRRAAVIGCGIVGLTSARVLQRRGFDVTIYAAALPPETTSNMSLATFTPTSGLVSNERRTPEWDAQFRRAVEIAYREHQLLVGSRHGVSWIDDYSLSDERRGRARRPGHRRRRWRRRAGGSRGRQRTPSGGTHPRARGARPRRASVRIALRARGHPRCASSRRSISTP